MQEKTTFKMPRFIELSIKKFIITKRRYAFEKGGEGGGGEGHREFKKLYPTMVERRKKF